MTVDPPLSSQTSRRPSSTGVVRWYTVPYTERRRVRERGGERRRGWDGEDGKEERNGEDGKEERTLCEMADG